MTGLYSHSSSVEFYLLPITVENASLGLHIMGNVKKVTVAPCVMFPFLQRNKLTATLRPSSGVKLKDNWSGIQVRRILAIVAVS